MKWLIVLLIFCSLTWSNAVDPMETSPKFPCGKNEVWEKCIENLCIAKRCRDLGYPLNCIKVPEKDCTSGCICQAGYLRNNFGHCVPLEYCPSCAGDRNATQGCSNYCKHSCSDYLDVDKECPLGCIQNGCKCRDGYVYHEELKQCVLPTDCPGGSCGPYAIRIHCLIRCPPTCGNPNTNQCSPYFDCDRSGCKCIDGYILDKIGGKCIRVGDCPGQIKSCGPNAIRIRCVIKNPPTCANPYPKPCLNNKEDCTKLGCKCIDGYILDKIGGTCIKVGDCPKSCRDPNAVWRKCGPGCPPSCDNYGNTCLVCPFPCKPGCFCKKGYVLNSMGDCIKPKYCPHKCGKNEYWDWCPPNCPHQRCSAIWSKFDCSKAPKCCIPQCRCRNGYYRNDKGICITIKECRERFFCGKHAHWSECINPCPKGSMCFVPCIAGCLCDKGYEQVNGVCVKKHSQQKCGKHAHWSECINPCPKGSMCFVPCIAGCLCDKGYEQVNGYCVKKY